MRTINKKIEMITCTEENGVITPLRFRIKCKDEEKQSYDVLRVVKTDLEKLAGNKMYVFRCEIEIDGKLRECIIKYELDSCKWCLFQV